VAADAGAREVADGTWAYLQPDGGWGWSNAGLVTDGDESLLVDTLFDLDLTATMLAALRRAAPAAAHIGTLVNTHANGDHCYGNQLVTGAEIVASRASAAEMDEVPPSALAALLAAAPGMGDTGAFLTAIFGAFTFDGIEPAPPTTTFEGSLDLMVGDRQVRLLELGPAHTRGDVAVHVPDAGVVFTGDLVFHGGHPIVWAGPVRRWIEACDRLLDLAPSVVVPGHGPLGDRSCIAAQRGYFEWLVAEGTPRLEGGLSPLDAARDMAGGPYEGWGEGERLVVNLTALGRDLGLHPADDVLTLFGGMAELAGRGRRSGRAW
jgi:glyoxylase-like metal-dependent hydrolase (beta-lactamase superfamily II)